MKNLYLTPAQRETMRAYPVTLPGIVGAPRLAARVRLARGTMSPTTGPSPETIAALADVRALISTHDCSDDTRDAIATVRAMVQR